MFAMAFHGTGRSKIIQGKQIYLFTEEFSEAQTSRVA